ncbi:MAG: tetratricopeptide repeat protein [Saprospiraceae bacterium]|nr:tetratricopeptide repeat protein [Candidatus Vicinibacter affinis]
MNNFIRINRSEHRSLKIDFIKLKCICIIIIIWRPFLVCSQSVDSIAIKEIDSLIQVSQKFNSKNNFVKALEVNSLSEKIALEKFGRESVSYGKICHNKGRILNSKGDYLQAESAYLEAKFIRELVLGEEHPEYLGTLINLATLYSKLSRFDEAEVLYLTSKSSFEKNVKNLEHPFYKICIINLGNLYLKLGKFSSCEVLFLQSKAISEKKFGKKHADYGQALLNLAVLYNKVGEYNKAESLYLETKLIYEGLMDKEDPKLLKLLNNIGRLYFDLFQYDKAEIFYTELKVIYEKAHIRDSIEYATYLDNHAILYFMLGHYDKAETFYLKSINITENILGKYNPNYLSCQNNLAILYQTIGQYSKAEYHYIESKEIREKVFGNKHFEYAASLNNMSSFYCEIGKYDKAELLCLEAKSIIEISLGSDHPEYANVLSSLANLYMNIGKYEKVEGLFLEAKEIYEKSLGRNHDSYLRCLWNLGKFYGLQCKFSVFDHLFTELGTLYQARMTKMLSFLSEIELNKVSTDFRIINDNLNSLLRAKMTVEDLSQGSMLDDLAYDYTLFSKGFLLNAAMRLNNLSNTSVECTEGRLQLKNCLRLLNAEYSKPIFERKGVLELEEQSNNLEKKLINNVSGYGEIFRQVKWQEVQSVLKWNEISIEFIHSFYYSNYYHTRNIDSISYAALILLPGDSTPRFVHLFESSDLNQLLTYSQSKGMDYVAEVYSSTRGFESDSSLHYAKSLYELIWQPLEPYLKGVRRIYFSPSGLLHRINQNAIAINDQTLLSDKYELIQLGSTRQLVLNGDGKNSQILDACIFGGINFEMDTTSWIEDNLQLKNDGIAFRSELSFSGTDSTLRGGTWTYLKGSEQEADEINSIIRKARISTHLFKGHEASEQAFKKLGDFENESPKIIHISTHGYFFPDPGQSVSSKNGVTHDSVTSNPDKKTGAKVALIKPILMHGIEEPGLKSPSILCYDLALSWQVVTMRGKLVSLSNLMQRMVY